MYTAKKRAKILDYYINFFTKGQKRSLDAKRNILGLFIIKGTGIIISLVLVPLTIDYVNPTRYGIWLTLSSVIGWFGFFDIGFGNGLRNRFAEARASGDNSRARIYLSTTYASLTFIFLLVWVLFFIINFFVNWSKILNAPPEMATELSTLAFIVFSFFCLQMVLKIISTLLMADQKPAFSGLINLLGQIVALITIVVLVKITRGSLLLLGLTIGLAPVLVLFVSSLWLFRDKYKDFAPSLRFVQVSYAKDILNLGYKFFIIQIGGLILFQSSNIIIAQLFGPEDVTVYNIAFKYFNVIPMLFSIIITPFWSAYTEAWVKHDLTWIKNVVNKLRQIWLLFVLGAAFMLLGSKHLYRLWVGNDIVIPIGISITLMIYVVIICWNTIFTQFINGVGKVHIQLYSAVWGSILNIPLAIYLGRIIGISGVILSTLILGLINSFWLTLQYKKLIADKATGIWAK